MPLWPPQDPVKNRSPFGVWAVFAFVGLGALGACQPSPDEAVPEDLEVFRTRPSQSVEQGYFEYTERGEVVQSLRAARLERWEAEDTETDVPDVWHVDGGFTLYIGGTEGHHTARLSAIRGTYDDEAGKLEAWDDVVLVNDDGERLETEHLVWSHDSDLVRTQRPVEIHTAQGVLRGRGLTSDSRFERYQILKPTGSFELGMDHQSEQRP